VKQVLFSGGARALGFLPQGIATLVASRLIIVHFGFAAFNAFALVVSLMALLPLNNLGAGASVTQSAASFGLDDERTERSALTAARMLSVSAGVVVVVATVLGALDLWPHILGSAGGGNAFTTAALILYALGFVPGLGQNTLLGSGRNHVSMMAFSFQAPAALAIIAVLVLVDAPSQLVLVVPPAALLVINLTTMGLSWKLDGFRWLTVLRRIPFRRSYPGASIRALSLPVMVTTVCIPLAFCSDRIVLSHVSTGEAVTQYSIVLQIFSPVSALILASAQPLWPMYTKARLSGVRGPDIRKVLTAFVVGTLGISVAVALVADPLGRVIGGSELRLGHLLPALAALVVLVQAIAFPLSMTMMDSEGARFVAWCAVLSLPLNIAASVWLSSDLGAAGPLISAVLVSVVVQVLPVLLFIRRREARLVATRVPTAVATSR